MENYTQTEIIQYGTSPRISAVIDLINQYFDPQHLVDFFYEKIWNLPTAEGYGLDVLGRIVGVSRTLNVQSSGYFSFYGTPDASAFGVAPFYLGGDSATSNINLVDSAFRPLVLAKALANIWDGSIPGLNRILLTIFGQYGQAWVSQPSPLAINLNFSFKLSNVDYAIVTQSGAIPTPPGVAVTVVQG